MPVVGIYMAALLGAAILSLAAFVAGVLAYRTDALPRTWRRKAELLALALPFIIAVSTVVLFTYAPGAL